VHPNSARYQTTSSHSSLITSKAHLWVGRPASASVLSRLDFAKPSSSVLERHRPRRHRIFRSQWDVASLARLITILGLRDKEDAEFWDSYVNGGHIGADFTAKALEMIDMAARDGPLLIFCQLGHLAATAVPLNQSGLKRKDIEKVWELQMKVIEDKRLPLNRASDTVWEALGQLREQVNDLCLKVREGRRGNICGVRSVANLWYGGYTCTVCTIRGHIVAIFLDLRRPSPSP
jgi:hypothetical protein